MYINLCVNELTPSQNTRIYKIWYHPLVLCLLLMDDFYASKFAIQRKIFKMLNCMTLHEENFESLFMYELYYIQS